MATRSEIRECVLQDRVCHYCKAYATTVDHVIPSSMGGSYTEDNLVPACEPCNNAKDNLWPTCPCSFCEAARSRRGHRRGTLKTPGSRKWREAVARGQQPQTDSGG